MLKVIGDLTVDANVRIFLNLFSSPALPDQIPGICFRIFEEITAAAASFRRSGTMNGTTHQTSAVPRPTVPD